jgi:hypothetical protein
MTTDSLNAMGGLSSFSMGGSSFGSATTLLGRTHDARLREIQSSTDRAALVLEQARARTRPPSSWPAARDASHGGVEPCDDDAAGEPGSEMLTIVEDLDFHGQPASIAADVASQLDGVLVPDSPTRRTSRGNPSPRSAPLLAMAAHDSDPEHVAAGVAAGDFVLSLFEERSPCRNAGPEGSGARPDSNLPAEGKDADGVDVSVPATADAQMLVVDSSVEGNSATEAVESNGGENLPKSPAVLSPRGVSNPTDGFGGDDDIDAVGLWNTNRQLVDTLDEQIKIHSELLEQLADRDVCDCFLFVCLFGFFFCSFFCNINPRGGVDGT